MAIKTREGKVAKPSSSFKKEIFHYKCNNCKRQEFMHERPKAKDWFCWYCNKGRWFEVKKSENDTETTPTTITSTTSTTITTNNVFFTKRIKNWGLYDIKNNLLIERLDADTFFYKIGNVTAQGAGIVELQEEGKGRDKTYSIYVPYKDGFIKYIVPGKVKPLYFTPSREVLESYIEGKIVPKDPEKLFLEIEKTLKTMFDFVDTSDTFMASLFLFQSFIDKKLNALFLASVDAKFGAGKTTLLEILCRLMLHGVPVGDISKASIPRLIDEWRIRIGIDEIDQLPEQQRTEIEQMLRRGQRRDNPFIRINKNTMETETFDTFGQAVYTMRTDTEDALASRSITIHTRISDDKRLPIINLHKNTILEPLCNSLWLWYLDNIPKFCSNCSEVVNVVGINDKDAPDTIREELYKKFTNFLTKDELKVFEQLFGRNIEIAYLMLQITNILGINLVEHIKKNLNTKQGEQNVPDNFYLEKFEERLRKKIRNMETTKEWKLDRGDFPGCHYYPKNEFFVEFNRHLKECEVPMIGNKKYNGFLKDFGFIQGYNLKNQRHWKDNVPIACLIFDTTVLKNLKKVEEEKPSVPKEDDENIGGSN